jgi:peptidoglycan-associated lipoprotein
MPPARTAPSRPSGFDQGGLQSVESARQLTEAGADRVYFSFDSYNLDAQARGIIERQARLLTTQGAINATIEGHCDERGTREYNIALGERRASAVRDYLIALGVAPNRLRVVSYGEERPAAIGSNEDAWAQNRRAVTVVMGAAAGS